MSRIFYVSFLNLIMLSLFFVTHTWAACPDWLDKEDVPHCPGGSSGLIPENYPAAVHIVSDKASRPDLAIDQDAYHHFPVQFVVETLKASGDRLPLFVLPVQEETFKEIQDEVAKAAGDDKALATRWLSNLVYVSVPIDKPHLKNSFPWQQDYFEAFKKGDKVSLRLIEARPKRNDDHLSALTSALKKACDRFEKGSPLRGTDDISGRPVGLFGGNIEGLPGGLCLFGNTQGKEFPRQYCEKADQVEIKTDWLKVGHVDEIVSVVRKPGAKAPCDFAIAIASPRRALELLADPQNAKTPFFSSFHPGVKDKTQEQMNLRRSFRDGIRQLCEVAQDVREKKLAQLGEATRKTAEDNPMVAHGVQIPPPPPAGAPPEEIDVTSHLEGCEKMTHGDVLQLFREVDAFRINTELIQKTMNENKSIIESSIKKKLPECTVEFIEVPDLFIGGEPILTKKEDPMSKNVDDYQLASLTHQSMVPNPTNAVPLLDSVLVPHPQNEVFAKDVREKFSKQGLSTRYIDTYDYAHLGGGNLHCATHSIRWCR